VKIEKGYTIELSRRSRIHVKFSREKKVVLGFSVNFEARLKKEWKPVIRYDTAHDYTGKIKWRFPHKHTYYKNGKEVITQFKIKDYNLALTYSLKDLRSNFKQIKSRFFNN